MNQRWTASELELANGIGPAAGTAPAGVAGYRPSTPEGLSENQDLLHVARLLALGEISSCFAHDVMNPLTIIRGNLDFAREALPAGHPARTYLDSIERASFRIEDMARRIRDFSRKRPARLQSLDVPEIVGDAIRFVQPYFEEKHVEVNVSGAPGLPPIRVDRWQFIQALVNVFQNAADAMECSNSRVLEIDMTLVHRKIRIAVRDTGHGISEEVLARIFTPFFSTKGDHGTGLGLYITKKIVEEHHGSIDVQTGSGGTTFVILIPVRLR
jgi:two-component system NtrC family sensor kinase